MINLNEIKENTLIWSVSHSIDEMIYPTQAKFIRKESDKGKKLSMVRLNQKTICYPTHLLFSTKKEALIYASVNFLKLYYEFDPFFISENIDEETLQDAYALVERFEEEDPSLFLYHWMGNVPNKF